MGKYEQIWKTATKKNSEIFFEILMLELRDARDAIQSSQKELEKILASFDVGNSHHKELLKTYADASRIPVMMIKYFLAKKIDKVGTDADFYNGVSDILSEYKIFDWYDALRNFVTKKIQAEDKMKLNFENSTLAGGWDVNKESANSCAILRDAEGYEYLAIMSK